MQCYNIAEKNMSNVYIWLKKYISAEDYKIIEEMNTN